MFLEEWIGDKIRHRARQDTGFHHARDGERVTRQELEDFQLFKLRETLFHAYEKSTFYRDLFRRHGVVPSDVRSLADLTKIPFTRPADLSESAYRFLCIPLGQIARVFAHTTSGTTGAPKKVFFTEEDIDTITECMGAITKTAALGAGLPEKGWVVQILMPDGLPNSQAKLIAKGVERMGSLPVVEDITRDIPDLIEAVKRVKPDILMGSVSRLHRITQEALLYSRPSEWGVKVVFITSEYLPAAMRERLGLSWSAEVYHHYGMTELGLAAAIECQAHRGFHLNEADLLVEAVNPSTGEVLPDGEEGELVFTTLSRRGMPLIRYETGDIAAISRQPCDCDSCITRIGQIAKKAGATIKLGTGLVYPSLFDDVLYRIPGLIDYRAFVAREAGRDFLTLEVEAAEQTTTLKDQVIQALLTIPAIKACIDTSYLSALRAKVVEPGTLRRTRRSKQRIVDNRSMS